MKRAAIAAAIGFLACIVAANYVTTEYGMVPVGFGLLATAGTYFAGLTFVLRDTVQDGLGKYATIALIALGAGLSYLVSDPFIATASGVAFLCAELSDLAIYTPLRERGYIRAAIASNVVGAFVDTVLFLWIAGFPIAGAIAGQMTGKLLVTAVVVLAVAGVRGSRIRCRFVGHDNIPVREAGIAARPGGMLPVLDGYVAYAPDPNGNHLACRRCRRVVAA